MQTKGVRIPADCNGSFGARKLPLFLAALARRDDMAFGKFLTSSPISILVRFSVQLNLGFGAAEVDDGVLRQRKGRAGRDFFQFAIHAGRPGLSRKIFQAERFIYYLREGRKEIVGIALEMMREELRAGREHEEHGVVVMADPHASWHGRSFLA